MNCDEIGRSARAQSGNAAANALNQNQTNCNELMNTFAGYFNENKFLKMMFDVSIDSPFIEFCCKYFNYQNGELWVDDEIANGELFGSAFENVVFR